MAQALSLRHTLFDRAPLDAVDFATGGPSTDLLPNQLFAYSSQLAFSESQSWAGIYSKELQSNTILQYGPELGDSAFRELLATFLSRRYHSSVPVSPDCLAVTPGASIGLLWALIAFTNAPSRRLQSVDKVTRMAFLPLPTYHLVFQTFEDVGFVFSGRGPEPSVKGIPEDENGIIVDLLEEQLRGLHCGSENNEAIHSKGARIFQFVLYLVPSHSNPSGTIISAEKRQKLIRLSRQYDMLIICDDVYDLLYYNDAQANISPIPERLFAYDVSYGHSGYVISNCSFSKILGPGVRCGWLEAQPALVDRMSSVGAWYSGGGTAALSNRLIMPLIADSALPYLKQHLISLISRDEFDESRCALDYHIDFICKVYESRRTAMIDGVERYLSKFGLENPKKLPRGGYFLWVDMPPHLRSLEAQRRVKEIAQEEKVLFHMGSTFVFAQDESTDSGYIRLCWAYNNEEQIEEGCRRMASVFRRLELEGS